eukprot:TRINITY_DN3118_c0_g1_i1.p1 TRINITY_DN3118_c0_g1~~TRINITY_DN3118_c0_g1_i1.p1  ORF type:complete len:495 (+),score=114.09 TRINITY_DN3118_c0_g1_i1:73-1557(+)
MSEIPLEAPTEEGAPLLNKTKSTIDVENKLVHSFADSANSGETDVIFSFDTTGSMYSYLEEVRKNLKAMASKLIKDVPKIRIGIIAMGDYCDDISSYVIKYLDFTNNADEICTWIEKVGSTGGGDSPEAYELALKTARLNFKWASGNKALVVIGDATPHPPSYTDQDIFWGDELDQLIKLGVKVYGVQANEAADATAFYEELSNRSGGVCIKLKHINLITDMFQAVCYKEFGVEHLETFRSEVETREGKMDAEREKMFSDLKRERDPAEVEKDKKNEKSFSYNWWSRANDNGRCCYRYDVVSQKYILYSAKSPVGTKKPPAPRKKAAPKAKSTPPPKAPVGRGKKRAASVGKGKGKKKAAASSSDDITSSSDSDTDSDSDSDSGVEVSPSKSTRSKKPRRASASATLGKDSSFKSGDIVAVRGENKTVWVAKIKDVDGANIEVQWFDELKNSPGTFVLLKWTDTIPVRSIISPTKVKEDKERGVFVLKKPLPPH